MPNPTYADPAKVTDRHCYVDDANSSMHVFFVLVDETTLDVYEGSGPCPADPRGEKIALFR